MKSNTERKPTDEEMRLVTAVGEKTVAFVNAAADLLEAAGRMHRAKMECDDRMETLISLAGAAFNVARLKVIEPAGGIAAGDLSPGGFVPTAPTKGH